MATALLFYLAFLFLAWILLRLVQLYHIARRDQMARQFTKKLAVSFLGTLSTLAIAGSAQAGCNSGTYCHASTGTHAAYNPPALSTWSQHSGYAAAHSSSTPVQYAASPQPISYSSSSYSVAAPTQYLTSSRTASRAACPAGSTRQADGICLSTSTSFSSVGVSSSYSVAPLTRSVLAGLGANESLQPTSCPVSVHNPTGAKVLGCYNVVKPKPVVRTVVRPIPTVYQVVRPVIYVPTPVLVQNRSCAPKTIFSRYGGAAHNVASCGW